MSAERVKAMIKRYVDSNHGDLSMMADDVVFRTMATGEEVRGREGVAAMLHHIYHVAFEAKAETHAIIADEKNAVLEGTFVGRHIGEFAGMPATNKEVRVPLCVVYDVEDDKIKRGRVYFEGPAFLAQVGAPPPK